MRRNKKPAIRLGHVYAHWESSTGSQKSWKRQLGNGQAVVVEQRPGIQGSAGHLAGPLSWRWLHLLGCALVPYKLSKGRYSENPNGAGSTSSEVRVGQTAQTPDYLLVIDYPFSVAVRQAR